MIYLSLLELSPRSRQVQAELANPYEMHRTLSKAFTDSREDGKSAEDGGEGVWEAARCLFRVDEAAASPHLRVLVQSRVRPDWDGLTVRPDYLAAAPCVKTWEPAFRVGQTLAFRLRANPTKKEDGRNSGRKNGRRLPLLTEADRLTWLARKAETGGFGLLRTIVTDDDPVLCKTTAGHGATLNAVRFDGILRVRDPEAFTRTVENGLGSAKAFGFGLLSVATAK